MARIYPSFEERFLSRFREDESGCWLVLKPGATGYGGVDMEGKTIPMHRASWLIHKKILPELPLCILHRCDNRACCNPDHLYVGTKKDNRKDFMERHPRAKEFVEIGIKSGAAGLKNFWDSMSANQRKKFCEGRRKSQLAKNGNTHPRWGTSMRNEMK